MSIKVVIIAVLSAVCAYSYADCPIEGTWRSDEDKTLESMNSIGHVTDVQRKYLENNFFGKLVIKSDCKEFTTYYEDIVSTTPYKSVIINGREITTIYYDDLTKEDVRRTVTFEEDGKCYSLSLGELGFREYFCRVK